MFSNKKHNLSSFRSSLLKWYNQNKRDLPWRKSKDPYSIWLSEIMLQQTTVKTVIPYYERFLKKFPTLESFIQATEHDYLNLWQGLGYYNRIRNFYRAALSIKKGAAIPKTKQELIKLPGLGDYTASAIASIAFNEPVAVVDGNVMRVLARLFAYDKEITSKEAKKFFTEKSQEILEVESPGDFNQAMMELGATVCTPKNPTCHFCPVNSFCEGLKKEAVEKFPVKEKKIAYKNEDYFCEIYIVKNKILLRQRLSDEIMQGLWELPLTLTQNKNIPTDIKPIRHSIMNKRMLIYPSIAKKLKKKNGDKWVALTDLKNYPLTTISRKVLRLIPNLWT